MSWLGLESERLSQHIPVLLEEVISFLDCQPGKNYIDLTVGGGGHSQAILVKTQPNGLLLGLDRDLETLEKAQKVLMQFGSRVRLVHSRFSSVTQVCQEEGFKTFHGALMDCGVSSFQLDQPNRGFSFREEGPLDMRMDTSEGWTAKQWVNQVSEKELREVIFRFGEERFRGRISRAILRAREKGPILTTTQLAEIIRNAVPSAYRHGPTDSATRTFQAIRMVINNELVELEQALNQLIQFLSRGSRLVVISFHSLEDRLVKHVFKEAEKSGRAKVLTKKPLRASSEEQQKNPRSRSAKLRALEFVGEAA